MAESTLESPPARGSSSPTAQKPVAGTPPESGLPSRTGLQLVVMLGAVFMSVLDGTIVNVATSTIRSDLHAAGSSLQLIVAGYTIAYAVLMITGARLGGRFGYRNLFLVGVIAFTVTSLACGLAPDSATLIAFRFLQGAGAAMMGPQVFSLIQLTFDGNARARALSLYTAVVALGSVVGQVVGGLLITADIAGTGWRPVFLINVPVGIALAVAVPRLLPSVRAPQGRKLDVPGLMTLTASVLALVVPLVLGHEARWPLWTKLCLASAAILFVAFVFVERAVDRRGGAPLISGRVLRSPGIAFACAALILGMSGYLGFLFSLAIHLQVGLGYSAAHTGLVFAPTAVGFAAASLTWQRLPKRFHRPMMVVGFVVASALFAVSGQLLRDGGSGGVALPPILFFSGLGMGFAFSPILSSALSQVAPADAPDASGLLNTVMQLGGVLGVASYGSLFLTFAARHGGTHPTATAEADTLLAVAGGILLAAASIAGLIRATRQRTDVV